MIEQCVFIGGVGRSGTSITRELFSWHSEVISFPFEYRFIIDPDGIIDFINSNCASWSPYLYDRRLKRLEKFLNGIGRKSIMKYLTGQLIRAIPFLRKNINTDSYHGWELEKSFPNYYQHVSKLLLELHEFKYRASWSGADSFKIKDCQFYSAPLSQDQLYSIFSNFFTELLLDLSKHHNKRILVEDNTWNLLFPNELRQLFHGAKFIHVYREPRDVVCSYLSQRWMPNDVYQSAKICADLYERIFNNTSLMNEKILLEISIEELVAKRNEKTEELFQFVGLEKTDNIQKFPFSNTSFGKWKEILSLNDIKVIEPVLREVTERLGYSW
ncbi:MAG: sulfotransferase [Gammaproteobacteria bacterium]|nr:sulfotransferase [Gammaproteobacteria bacterium]